MLIKLLGMVSFSQKKIALVCLLVIVAAGLTFSIFVWRAAHHEIQQSAQIAAGSAVSRTSFERLNPVVSKFEPMFNAPEFRAAVQYEGDVFICGAGALVRYSEGQLKQSWSVGRDFPPTQLLSLAVRIGIGNPELWIATDGAGVLIYDGSGFRQLLSEKVAERKISALLPLANGQMLVGTRAAGLYVSDGKILRVFHPQFEKVQVTALAGDEDQLWIGTRADGAWLWRGGEAQHISAELPDKQVVSLAYEGGTAWVGTPLGIAEYKDGKLSRRLADGVFAQTMAEHDGKLWVGTVDQGTFTLPLNMAKPRPRVSSKSGDTDSVVGFAQLGGELAAVEPRVLVNLSDRRPLISASANTLSSNHVSAIHEDTRGRVWVGYFDRGIDLLPASSTEVARHMEDDTIFCINRIKENPQDDSMLAGTANGLAIFDSAGTIRRVFNRESGLIASHVTDILYQAGSGTETTLAIATPAGVSFYRHGAISSVYAFEGLVNNHVYTLADLNGTLYAGTLGGVSTLRSGFVQASFNTANSTLRQNWITASAVSKGQLFLGTYGSGVVQFEGNGEVRAFPSFATGRFEINQNAMLATERAVYAGTAGQGLAILRNGEERWQFVSAGLPSLNVTALDERGDRLYVGTDNGLVRISENNLLP